MAGNFDYGTYCVSTYNTAHDSLFQYKVQRARHLYRKKLLLYVAIFICEIVLIDGALDRDLFLFVVPPPKGSRA